MWVGLLLEATFFGMVLKGSQEEEEPIWAGGALKKSYGPPVTTKAASSTFSKPETGNPTPHSCRKYRNQKHPTGFGRAARKASQLLARCKDQNAALSTRDVGTRVWFPESFHP